MISIPDILKDGSFRFIRLKKQQKEPIDEKWQTVNNFEYSDPKIATHIQDNGNYGVICSSNDVCILDADVYERLEQLGALEPFKDTFTVRTGYDKAERYHYYFRCKGLGKKKIPFYDLEVPDLHLGELYPAGAPAYCVGPGSIHPSGKTYEIVNTTPIKNLELSAIEEVFFSKVKSTRKKQAPLKELPPVDYTGNHDTLTNKAGLRIEVIAPPQGNIQHKANDDIQGVNPWHGSSRGDAGNNYAINALKNCFSCYRCGSGGDALHALAIENGLLRCEDCIDYKFSSDELTKLEKLILDGKADEYCAENLKKAIEEDKRQYAKQKEEERIREKSISEEEFKRIDDRPDIKELKFKINVPEDHFISKYVKHHLDKTDAYPDYHYAAALTLLSIAADRKIIIPLSQGDVYTNLWIMNLGRSSFSRKSTALRTVKYVVGAFGAFHELPGMFSTEGLIESFDDNSHGHLIKDECAQILGSINKKQYMSDVRDVLCELYDCGNIKRKLRTSKKNVKSEYEIKDSYPVFLMATTPDNFFDNSTKLDITSGWLIRFLYVFPRYPKKTKGLEIGTEQGKISLNNIGNDFNNIAGNVAAFDQIEMIPSNKGLDEFNEWFISRQEELENDEEDLSLHSSVFSRILITALKIAALLTLGDKSCENEFKSLGVSQDIKIEDIEQIKDPKPKIIIPDKYMQEATRLIDEYFLPIACDIIDDITVRENENIQGRIIQVIKESPGCKITRSQLLKKMRITSKILDEHINTLEEADEISYFVDKSKPKYTLFYCLNKGKSNNKSIFDF